MGFESTVPLTDHLVDKSEVETSQVLNCDSTVVEEMKNSLSEEVFLQVPLENKEDTESLGICDLENNKGDVAEAITPWGDIPELSISSKVSDDIPSLGCETPRELSISSKVSDDILSMGCETPCELSISSKVSDDILSLGCETPRESIFDPFAPGPEEAVCAPKKKVIRGAEVLSRRKLNFDDYPVKRLSFDWNDSDEEDQYLQLIHKMILDIVISDGSLDQEEETQNNLIDSFPDESFETPDSKPLLTGIATTCPDAPLRPSLKVLKLSPSICRKIDFDSVSPRSSAAKENN